MFFSGVETKSDMSNTKRITCTVMMGLFLLMIGQASVNGDDEIWHVKAVHPEGQFLDVKAFDKSGKSFDVKAIQKAKNLYLMDIKAFVDGKKLPVKILTSSDTFSPLKAICTSAFTLGKSSG